MTTSILIGPRSRATSSDQARPILTHVESGARLIVPTPPKVGALRNTDPPQDGRFYWMLFANPGSLVEAGDHVDIGIGAFQLTGLLVE